MTIKVGDRVTGKNGATRGKGGVAQAVIGEGRTRKFRVLWDDGSTSDLHARSLLESGAVPGVQGPRAKKQRLTREEIVAAVASGSSSDSEATEQSLESNSDDASGDEASK